MPEQEYDQIHIRDLLVRCIVGIYPDERENLQDVLLNITMYADFAAAGRSDSIKDTINYKSVKKRIVEMVEASSYHLIERLAEEVASIALNDPRVRMVDVTVDKPGALRFARSVAVQVRRVQRGAPG